MHRFKTCNNCQRKGHLDVVCRTKTEDKQNVNWQSESPKREESDEYDFLLLEQRAKRSRPQRW